ncbi:MAG: CotH kinase family protein [Bacteroidaceae bacterium]|nr:CotH kinase family protein [Bacteroidaceae bacterium]
MYKTCVLTLAFCASTMHVAAQFQRMSLKEVLGLGLPVVEVVTVDSVMPTATPVDHPEGGSGFSVTDATKVPGRLAIWVPGPRLVYSSGNYAKDKSGMTIKIRGNNSARRRLPPYKIKLQRKADLLCRGDDAKYEDKNWLLLKETWNTLATPIGFKVNELLNFSWTPSWLQVNLLLNGEYRGIYLLTEQVRRNPRCRIDVDEESGYIIERDIYWWVAPLSFESDLYHWLGSNWQRYTFKYPDEEDVTEQQIAYIREAVNQMEEAVVAGEGYAEYMDVESFAAWTLGHDILGTYDGGGANRYLIKYDDTTDSRFHMGTMWDFETNFYNRDEWSALHTYYGHYCPWLFPARDQSFRHSYVQQWHTISSVLEKEMIIFLDSIAATTSAALDSSRVLEEKLHYREFKSVADNVAEAKEWFHTRIAWIDEHIAEIDTTDIKTGIVGITEKMPTSLNVKASSLNCYDLSGRRLSVPSASSVSSVLPKGVYIEDGKKRVRK